MNLPCAGPTAIQYEAKEQAWLGLERNTWKQVPPGNKRGTEMAHASSRERDWLQTLIKLYCMCKQGHLISSLRASVYPSMQKELF